MELRFVDLKASQLDLTHYNIHICNNKKTNFVGKVTWYPYLQILKKDNTIVYVVLAKHILQIGNIYIYVRLKDSTLLELINHCKIWNVTKVKVIWPSI